MSINIIIRYSVLLIIGSMTACGEQPADLNSDYAYEQDHGGEGESVHFSAAQFEALGMIVDTLPLRNMSSAVQASGQLEVPPQNEAMVTAIVGANILSIQVIEGEEVKKGQVLAYLAHPNLTRLQSDYLEAYIKLEYLEQDYQRQKKLYDGEVGSGKDFQQTQADYRSTQGMVKSFQSQLRQLGLKPERITEGDFYEQVPVVSPIDGAIVKVGVRLGQYVQPEKNIFEIVNTHHIHADLMVFEKDVLKVKQGQQVRFIVDALPDTELTAEIYSVGKKFEQNLKAVHVHAEIINLSGALIPGMYIKGEILTDSSKELALPEAAISRDGDKYFAFIAQEEAEGEAVNWMFTPVEVIPGSVSSGWQTVKFLKELPGGAQFAMNNSYYLLAEMKKGEGGHSH